MRLSTKLYSLAGGVALALAAGACDSGLTDINDNPNAPVDVDPEFIFPQGVVASVSLVRGAGFDLTMTSLWTQHIAKIQYIDEDWYEIRPQTINAWWSAFYSGPLQDFTQVIRQASGGGDEAGTAPQPLIAGPAIVMKQWTFGAMTDIWGDIPYSEANQGDMPEADYTPAYDTQQEIYSGMLAALTDASTLMSTGSGIEYGGADPIYGGDPAAWQTFANSLRLRYAIRLADVDPTRAQSEITAALAAPGGVFENNADNATLVFPGDGTNDNPWYTNFRSREDHRVSETLIDTLIGLDDPRLAVYAQPFTDADEPDYRGTRYRGIPNGLSNTVATSVYGLAGTSRPGAIFIEDPAAPLHLMTYAEVEFILAEAAERGWISGSAAEHYEAGIRASMNMPNYGISSGEIDAYIVQPEIAYTAGSARLDQIAFQKWLALYGQGAEAFAEYRRTNVPVLEPGPEAILDEVASRLFYPSTEQSFNAENLQAAITSIGGDELTTHVWWDVD
ncbi:MAG: SusD/RagB family nutrient-binding outer membrane lipoprotein [Gemmatimonadaceae bacterium]